MTTEQKIYSKESLIEKLKEINSMGWIENRRHGNDGGVGNTLEYLLGIEENNLPIANATEWELKTQRGNTTSLTTLCHYEPSPRAVRFVPAVFLPKYGWAHDEAGKKYPEDEMSFRQTISAKSRSDRGFNVVIDRIEQKISISFDAKSVSSKHTKWLQQVKRKVGLNELSPQPYWGFADLEYKIGAKLLNTFYVKAEVKRIDGKEHYKYSSALMLKKFSFSNFLTALEKGIAYVDFDARTGHNHGTKLRIRQNNLPTLYESVVDVL